MSDRETLRIVHCVRAPIGGIFRHVVDLAQAQTAAGHAVGIVCDASTGGAFEEATIARVAPRLAFGVSRFPMRRALSPSDGLALWRLWRRIAEIDPDVLHGHGSKGGSYARLIGTALRLRRRRTARIYCPHGGSLHFDARSLEGRIYFALERILERMTDGLVFVSDFERRRYEDKIGRPKVPSVLAHNGLRPEEFEPVTADADAADFLHIGMLRELKGTDVFIRALDELRRHGPAATALVVGVGDERPTYEDLVRDLDLADHVAFHDPLPIRDALRRARAVVLPSRAESLPYVALEAIAAGVPLIATRVGGLPEIFGADADRLVPPGDVVALAEAMRRHLLDPVEGAAFSARLRGVIADRFAVATMTRTIEALYRRILEPMPHSTPSGRARGGRDLPSLAIHEPSAVRSTPAERAVPEGHFPGADR